MVMTIGGAKEAQPTIGVSRRIKPVLVRIKLVDNSFVVGKINIGYETRLSELFINNPSPFVVVFDAAISEAVINKTFIVNKANIVWVLPEEEPDKEERVYQKEG
ncbi:MAG: hypothetical protein AB1634_05830 [Thermodesulfobacteriota bacterium]